MPTYDYECTKCGHTFEVLQKMTDKPKTACPQCKGKLRRLIGAGAGIIFKGSGFYETDYKRKSTAGSTPHSDKKAPAGCPKAKEGCSGCAGA